MAPLNIATTFSCNKDANSIDYGCVLSATSAYKHVGTLTCSTGTMPLKITVTISAMKTNSMFTADVLESHKRSHCDAHAELPIGVNQQVSQLASQPRGYMVVQHRWFAYQKASELRSTLTYIYIYEHTHTHNVLWELSFTCSRRFVWPKQ